MKNCKNCEKLLSILKDVKTMMDSDEYLLDFDSIYNRIAFAIEEQSNKNKE